MMTGDMRGYQEDTRFPEPHLSYSRINRYLLCPEQYRLYYIENLRAKVPAASLMFGKVIHQALAGFFAQGSNPMQTFLARWQEVRDIPLTFGPRESWESLNTIGQELLKTFLFKEYPKIGAVQAVEKEFTLSITGLDLPLVGIIDLVAEVDGVLTVVDFKTSGSRYGIHEVALSDQLSIYRLAEPEVEQLALCVLVKTKDPKIEWHIARRSGRQLTEFLEKVGYVAREIQAGHFYKRPGNWCRWCDYLPVCMGERAKERET